MPQQHFYLRLIPCRPDFAFTMTIEERAIMENHIAYCSSKMEQGLLLLFGPVMDPAGPFGVGILAVTDEQEVKDFIAGDPASGINRYTYHPMRVVMPGNKLI